MSLNPYVAVLLQSVTLTAAAFIAWWLGEPWFGVVAAVCIAIMASMGLVLFARYLVKLRGPGAVGRSNWRRAGDYLVAFELLLPAVSAVLMVVLPRPPAANVFASLEIATFSLMLATLFVFVLGSSFWDWWYVLPERDGLVRLPPCMSAGDPRWSAVTETWLRHRLVAEVAAAVFFLAFPVALAAEVWHSEPGRLQWLAKAVSPIALLLSWMFGFSKLRVPIGMATIIDAPGFALGETITWRVPRQIAAPKSVTNKSLGFGPIQLDLNLRIGRWFKPKITLPSSNGEDRYLFDVSLANATTFRVRAQRKGAYLAPYPVPMSALVFPGAIKDRPAIPYCAIAERCLLMHKDCARLPQPNEGSHVGD